jgi:hypothetical protein
MNWRKKLDTLIEVYMNRGVKRGLGRLNEFERPLCLIPPFSLGMNAGGFAEFFGHLPVAYVTETADAPRRIGAPASASLLEQAIRDCFGDQPVPDDDARQQLVEVWEDSAEAYRLDEAYQNTGDGYTDDLLLAYAKEDESRFVLTEDEAATAVPLEGKWRQCTKCWDAWEHPPKGALAQCPACHALTLVRGS